ncbi:MAG: UDP-N-acetylglucosamine--N-acetylmuramyl-(pentapeptide) pyrophosphoryl-undecaprenol N-acetylglucosamine transferase [Elusimicrobia bacterium]|nr:UDP-N-acetylglucosamine--N-acetylmuramyl-(pentapeptide) pyrophosphoryl-undecaprenol N-acetylglucosamine transferase [Elusimicrobiota bacterium]
MKRIIIAGGGTGGHFYPGLSIALKLKSKGIEILFAVKKNDISLETLKEKEIPYVEIDAVSFPRGLNPLSHFRFMFKLFSSFFYSMRIIKDFAPQAVLGTGSYVSFPMAAAAKIKKIKVYLHESNSIMGFSNKAAGIFADKIFYGLPLRENLFPNKTVSAGIPLREEFEGEITKKEAREKLNFPQNDFIVLVLGGSQGSASINSAFYKTLLDLSYENKQLPFFIHISGKNNYAQLKESYEKAGLTNRGIILPYCENMPVLYCAADAVISRSGSGTIAELCRYKKPALLIPLKTAAGDHQTFNAMALSSKGCAMIIKDDEFLFEKLKQSIEKFLTLDNISAMKKAYERLDLPSNLLSAEKISEEIIKDIGYKKNS